MSLDEIEAPAYRQSMDALLVNQVNELLAQFGQATGLRGLQLSEEGNCAFDHPSGLTVVVELGADVKVLHWYCRLCNVPAEEREHFYEQLLEKNLLGLQTNGAVIGLDKRSNDVVVSYRKALESLDVTRFTNVMENFVDIILAIRESLEARFHALADAFVDADDDGHSAFAIRV